MAEQSREHPKADDRKIPGAEHLNLDQTAGDDDEGFDDIDAALDNVFALGGNDEAIDLREERDYSDLGYSETLDLESHEEVKELFERIFLQYLQPIQTFIDNLSRGHLYNKVVQTFSSTLRPLIEATEQLRLKEMTEVLSELQRLVGTLHEDLPKPLPYKYIRPFAVQYDTIVSMLSEEVREEYFSEYRYTKNSNPLLEEFRNIRNIGPKRLQRLYAAGLTTIEGVESAYPEDIAVTTGISIKLVYQIKEVAKLYRMRRERDQVQKVKRLTSELMDAVKGLRFDRSLRVVKEVAPGLKDLNRVLEEEGANWERRLLLAASHKHRRES